MASLFAGITSAIRSLFAQPVAPITRARPDVESALNQPQQRGRPINATYDAASSSSEFSEYWANADHYDADTANSKAVRSRLVTRSRYEVANNGYADGIVQTFATDLVGTGPRLRMQTSSKPFNQAVERVFGQWAKAIKLRRKLWTMAHAKVQDGEAFAMLVSNPRIKHPIKLDLQLIETEQVQTPWSPLFEPGYIDGVRFDQQGNVEYYDVLRKHPGNFYSFMQATDAERVPADSMLHWYLLRRPGQHRGVPEFRSTLQVGASSRRWREATIAAAETAADYSVILKTNLPPDGTADEARPFTSYPIEKRTMITTPMGWDMNQMKSEHPNATYEAFNKAQIAEYGRPKSMPYNKAAADNTGNSFSGGKLDQLGYYATLDVEREDANDLVLDALFAAWWEEAVLVYGWAADPKNPPTHSWDWPKHPVADIEAEANSNDTKLKNGSLTLSALYSENGEDFEDSLTEMATDFGVTEDVMREKLLNALFNDKGAQASMAQVENQAASQASQPPADQTASTQAAARKAAIVAAQTFAGTNAPGVPLSSSSAAT